MKLRCGWWQGGKKKWFYVWEVGTDVDEIFDVDLPKAMTQFRALLTKNPEEK